MATPILPVLNTAAPWLGFPGLAWDVVKSPGFSTTVHKTMTGRTARTIHMPAALYDFEVTFNVLRDQLAVARNVAKSAPYNEFETLLAFFGARYGRGEPFLITDPSDHDVTSQVIIATTPASTTDYQLVRTVNGLAEPIGALNTSETVTIRVDGTPTSAYTANLPYDGWIRFDSAPSAGVEINGDFDYYFKVAFAKDQLNFRTDLIDRWEARRVQLEGQRP